MSNMKILNIIIITLVLLNVVNAASFPGREVIKAFSACANATLTNIVEDEDCKFIVWENLMKPGPRKNVQIRYYALENNSCMALKVPDQDSSINIVRVVASAFLMPHSQSRCYYNHRVILKYDETSITMTLHKYSGNRPDEYVYTFGEDETIPKEIRLIFTCMTWDKPHNFEDNKEDSLIYNCDDLKEWKKNKLYHGIMNLFAVDLLAKKPVVEKMKRIVKTPPPTLLPPDEFVTRPLVTKEFTTPRTFVFTKRGIKNLMVVAVLLSILELLYMLFLFMYVWNFD